MINAKRRRQVRKRTHLIDLVKYHDQNYWMHQSTKSGTLAASWKRTARQLCRGESQLRHFRSVLRASKHLWMRVGSLPKWKSGIKYVMCDHSALTCSVSHIRTISHSERLHSQLPWTNRGWNWWGSCTWCQPAADPDLCLASPHVCSFRAITRAYLFVNSLWTKLHTSRNTVE